MMRKIHLYSCLFLLALPGISRAQEKPAEAVTHAFSVLQATDYAMQNSVQVKNALTDIKIQKEVNRQITAAALPQINASFSLNDYLVIPTTLIPAEIAGGPAGTFLPVQFGVKYNALGGIDLSQILFDGQVFVGLQARKASIDFYTKQADVTKIQIKSNVIKIYYQLVVAKEQLKAIDANIERFEKLLTDTRAIYQNGFAEKLDVDKVSVQLNNLKTEKIKLVSQMDAGYAGLKFLMNMPQKDSLYLTDTLSEAKLKDVNLAADYQYSDRFEYKLLQVAQELGQYNVKRYKLSYLPTVAAFASYSKNALRQEFNFFNDGSWFTTSIIGLSVQVPIFDGFARKANVNKAKLELQKTNQNLEQLKSNIDNEVKQATLTFQASLKTLESQKTNMQLAEEVYNSTKLKYEQGLGSNQEIYAAQAELKVAQSAFYGALYDAVVSRVEYQRATGKL